MPLGAEWVLVQIKDLDFVLHEFFGALLFEHIPIQRGIARVVHVVHVREVGRRLRQAADRAQCKSAQGPKGQEKMTG